MGEARTDVAAAARRLSLHGRRAVVERARRLAGLSRAPAEHVRGQRRRLHQLLRELRASATRGVGGRRARLVSRATVLSRQGSATAGARAAGRRAALDSLALALTAHDPERVLDRGYAMVGDRAGNVLTSAAAAREAGDVRLRFADAGVEATITDRGDDIQ